jgi:hypothetical protein
VFKLEITLQNMNVVQGKRAERHIGFRIGEVRGKA